MQETLDPRSLAAFIGICPIKHESGSSSTRLQLHDTLGPKLRKLLMAACPCVRTKSSFSNTFTAKSRMASTKTGPQQHPKQVLKIACACPSQQPYLPNYVAVNPLVFQKTLTAS
ncbi:MAG: transposase [Anaerolineae bacterium]|nr:transposase [Anaerolineae bacterium]